MERQRLPDRSGIESIVEEDHQRASPVAPNGPRMTDFLIRWPIELAEVGTHHEGAAGEVDQYAVLGDVIHLRVGILEGKLLLASDVERQSRPAVLFQ